MGEPGLLLTPTAKARSNLPSSSSHSLLDGLTFPGDGIGLTSPRARPIFTASDSYDSCGARPLNLCLTEGARYEFEIAPPSEIQGNFSHGHNFEVLPSQQQKEDDMSIYHTIPTP